ncbi:MAG: 5'-3' exonuclease H3TH domain-containing protein, partial [Acidobacteriota bacterium]
MRIHLVDSSPYIFRAFFSIPSSVTAPDGTPANAIYGFGGFLLKLLDDESVSHIALAFDRSLTTSFRNDIYPEYKAQRELPPRELEDQLDGCEKLGEALGLKTFSDKRYEAEDLLGSLLGPLAEEAPEAERVLVSSDKDLAQLVDAKTELFDLAKDTRYDAAGVREKFGVEPAQIADYLALAGDTVDNIPGVPGIGKKTAAALLAHRPDVEALLSDTDGVAELPIRGARSLAKKLTEHADAARLSKRLATIATDAPARATPDELAIRPVDFEAFDALTERWASSAAAVFLPMPGTPGILST